MSSALVVLGNQLFDPQFWPTKLKPDFIYMAEDEGLCRHYKPHQQKILFFLASMRRYFDEVTSRVDVKGRYTKLGSEDFHVPFEEKLRDFCRSEKIQKLYFFEIEDKFFEERIKKFAQSERLDLQFMNNPQFILSRAEFKDYLENNKRPLMKQFYEGLRKKTGYLMDSNSMPVGGQFSYDSENRKPMPKELRPPKPKSFDLPAELSELRESIARIFSDHPGGLEHFRWGTSRDEALFALEDFVAQRFENFGSYQDSITPDSNFVFHSLISPYLNVGLITPKEVIEILLEAAQKNRTPLNSVEGLLRQILGWREFVRGIYQEFSELQDVENFWGHQNTLKECWYDGSTGIPPLDDAIKKAQKFAYNHHIERLMIVSNLMLLCRVRPQEVHRWFMEMFIDSSDWVMGPNVYGMGQFSDGGIFATKPYISGSSYILKMSNYKKGDWCEIWDGLYWSFISDYRSFFEKNPRLSMMTKTLDKLDLTRKKRIFEKAENFRARVTRSA